MNIASALGGHYAIERELGRGAMATVYLARDLKHSRDVAIKVLSPELAEVIGAERFLREIDVVSRLHHPHILPLFDSGASDGVLFYVMPRVDGESLQQRLRREKQLPIPVALQLAREIAGALDFAHRHGVIHRDIKPGNILLQDGQALVADFGIALASAAAGGDRLTSLGISPGTPGYMSPEQAAGEREIDGRSDVYSLGCVVYEMLAGEPPVTGATLQVVIARTLHEVPRSVRDLRPSVPRHVASVLQGALEKLPADRIASPAEFARALDGSGEARAAFVAQDPSPEELRPGRRRAWFIAVAVLGWAVAAMVIAVAILMETPALMEVRETGSASVNRWEIVLPDSAPLAFVGQAELGIGRSAVAISPDGRRLAYVARRGATTQLYTRALDELAAIPLPGTDGAHQPFFSPDGRWVAFFAGGELKKAAITGDQTVAIARVGHHSGGAWSDDNRILVSTQGGRLSWVSAAGGLPQVSRLQTDVIIRLPELLPGGELVLHWGNDGALYVTSLTTGRAFAFTRDSLVPRESADISTLLYGTNPRYVASGHIIYLATGDGTLMALPFDLRRRRVLGPPMPVLRGVRRESEYGAGHLAVSANGTLLYAPGQDATFSQLAWVDRAGQVDTLPFPRAAYGPFDLSPDGRRLVVRIEAATSRAELWIFDLDGGARRRLPIAGIPRYWPFWWADGRQIVHGEFGPKGGREGPLILQSVQTPDVLDTILPSARGAAPSPDGRQIAVFADSTNQSGIWLRSVGDRGAALGRRIPGAVAFPAFSPDGRWLAYNEQAGGQWEIYVVNTVDFTERYKISPGIGEEPQWSPRGGELFYRSGNQWFTVPVSTTNGFRFDSPRLLFEGPYLQVAGWSYDVAPDGQRFLVLVGPPEVTTNRLVAVTNWFAELNEIAPRRN